MPEIYPWLLPQWQQIMARKQQQHLPHALLFSGYRGLGKTELAYALGHALLCCPAVNVTSNKPDKTKLGNHKAEIATDQACGVCNNCLLLAAGTHPDLYSIKPTPPKKSKSKTPVLNIRIDAIRELCHRLNQTSQMSGYRIAIIEQADIMNTAAANSLLKTLEEPGDNTLLILVSAAPNRLPATIRSRCQQVKFSQPEYSQVKNWLMHHGGFKTTTTCQYAFRLVHNAPLAALVVAKESEQRQLLASALLTKLNAESILDYSLKLSQCDKQQLLGWMLDWVNDLVYLSNNRVSEINQSRIINQANSTPLKQLAKNVDNNRLFSLQSQLLQTLQQGSIALNPQLLWENLLLSWDTL